MIVHFGVEALAAEWPRAAATLGVFDGVHLGHQALIRRTVELGRQHSMPSLVVTFHPHPSLVLGTGRTTQILGTLDQNLAWAAECGPSVCVVLKFDEALSRTPAEEFYEDVLARRLKIEQCVVGRDFAFGRGRVGTTSWLAERTQVEVLDHWEDGERVSSSRIREQIECGDVEGAARLLGRPFALRGVVSGGAKLGRTLGYPTINLARSMDQAIPGDGVYAGRCRVNGQIWNAAVSVGVRPTVEAEGARVVEAFLLDYPGDEVYGLDAEVAFVRRLRGQERFGSVEALVSQMERDVAAARLVLPA